MGRHARRTLLAWQHADFTDLDSLSTDPLFVDPANSDGSLGYQSSTENGSAADFHEQSQYGSFHGGSLAAGSQPMTGFAVFPAASLTVDANQSPVIDAGAASDQFATEPAANGGFVNIVAYGNTPQASLSPPQYVKVTYPSGGQSLPELQTVNVTWRTQDQNENVLSFTGGNYDFVQLPNGLISSTTVLTLELWFKTTGSGVLFGYQDAAYSSYPGNSVPALYVGTDGLLRGEIYNGSIDPITTTTAVNDGQWHYVALVANSVSQSLYLDGALVGTLAGTINQLDMTTNQVGMGYTYLWPATNNYWFGFSGLIHQAIWNVASTPANIQADMIAVPVPSTPGLVASYLFNEGTGSTTYDQTSNHNNGQLGGGRRRKLRRTSPRSYPARRLSTST